MAKLVGFEAKSFTFDDGNKVNGYYLHTEEKINGVTGLSVDRSFVSEKKLDGYIPVLGDEIELRYNRFGKIQSVQKL